MKSLTKPGSGVTYTYNGLGDRLRETVNGVTTSFTMDLNAGLTQALSDGANTYIYGVGRIAQVNTNGTEYFLGDALGSVRQLTSASGAITYTKAYDPYGVMTSTGGSSSTAYGYTSEFTSNNLVYLRARMYAPGVGRFLTRDIWIGDYNSPLSLNRWMYVEGNPVNLIDPSGQNWQYPTGPESTAIHKMITANFAAWGREMGRGATGPVYVIAASKEGRPLIKTSSGTIYRPIPDDVDNQNYGFADLLDLTMHSIYEIKTYRSRNIAIADARWYQYFLNIDENLLAYGPWSLGIEYLAEYKGVGRYIGPWPNDPKHAVMAELYASGAVVYWGKDANDVREPSFENADEYARYLVWLSALLAGTAAAGAAGRELGKRRQPEGVRQQNIDILEWLCQTLSNSESPFDTGPITFPILIP